MSQAGLIQANLSLKPSQITLYCVKLAAEAN